VNDQSEIGVLELVASAVLGAIVWLIARATGAHLDSMRELGTKLEDLRAEVVALRSELRSVSERQSATERRVERLEQEERARP
jgi:cell division protein FtsB